MVTGLATRDRTADRTKWLEDRRTAITATDAAKILGVSKYGGRMSVWLDKTGKAPLEGADSSALRFGRRFERPILEEYADREQVQIAFADSFSMIRSKVIPRVGATLDAYRNDDLSPVDAKNVGYEGAEWGPDGSDVFPAYYAVQIMLQMFVMQGAADLSGPIGPTRAHLAVLFNRYKFHVYNLPYDPETALGIAQRCEDFWNTYVKTDTPPPVDGSEEYSGWLKNTLKQSTDDVVKASPELHETAVHLKVTREQLKMLQEVESTAENTIKQAIGAVRALQGPNWKATWSAVAGKKTTDWQSVARGLANAMPQPHPSSPSGVDMLAGLVAQHTAEGAGYRRFTFNFKESE